MKRSGKETRSPRPTVITGRTVLPPDIGVPGLVAIVLDLESSADLDSARHSVGRPVRDNLLRDIGSRRLGSAVTGNDGSFSLAIDDVELPRTGDRRPDLVLLVMGPEESSSGQAPLLHVSGVRWNAGRQESFLVTLAEAQLREAGVVIPKELQPTRVAADIVVSRAAAAINEHAAVSHGLRQLRASRLTELRRVEASVAPALAALSAELAGVATDPDNTDPTYIPPGRDILEAAEAAVFNDIKHKVNGKPRTGTVVLTDEQLADLRTDYPNLRGVPSARIEPLIFGSAPIDEAHALVRHDPLAAACRDQRLPAEICTDRVSSDGENVSDRRDVNSDEDGPTPAIADLIRRLIGSVETPDNISFAPPRTRGSARDARDDALSLELRGGPADEVALHDYHRLEIAFRPVWQAAIDGGIVDVAGELYRRIVELGGDIDLDAVGSIIDKLQRERDRILDAFGGAWPGRGGASRTGSSGTGVSDDSQLADLDENFKRLRDLLRESEHPFTQYAANKLQRSVNFGLLSTYRQRWEPGVYQVGELVKTIPLAPGEIKTYSTKRVTRTTRAEKEVLRAQEMRRRDAADTSRDTAEIVRKAQVKTAFEMNVEGKSNLLVKEGTVTSKLSTDAGRSSSETKTRWRESVRKSATEFKRDRRVEVSTSGLESIETREAGEISNPNKELTVTYLFYELERRYRVSERIHRVTPVILVAQEMPKPNEITESWLLSREWILRRALLDDSFHEALDSLAGIGGQEVALLRSEWSRTPRATVRFRVTHGYGA